MDNVREMDWYEAAQEFARWVDWAEAEYEDAIAQDEIEGR